MKLSTTLRSFRANTAGIDCTPKVAATRGLESTSTLASTTSPPVSSISLSKTGPKVRHGPHHVAHRSTTTGTSAERSSTSVSNVASVTSISLRLPLWNLLPNTLALSLQHARSPPSSCTWTGVGPDPARWRYRGSTMADRNETLAILNRWPEQLERPVLVLGMEGWIDAGLGGAGAVSALLEGLDGELIATFDSDALLDQRARRPVVQIVNGVNTNLVWPEITLTLGLNGGRHVLVLSGPEPDMRWRQFTREIVAMSTRLGVELVVGLGAFPAPVPHTRPIRLVATATTRELADQVGYLPSSIEVPAGIHASLERGFADAGLPAVGIWARVPHYAAGMPYPRASEALLDKLTELTGLAVDTSVLHSAAEGTLAQLDQLIKSSGEHLAMVRQLEQQHDDEATTAAFDFGELPSGDEIAAELERYLRDEQG